MPPVEDLQDKIISRWIEPAHNPSGYPELDTVSGPYPDPDLDASSEYGVDEKDDFMCDSSKPLYPGLKAGIYLALATSTHRKSADWEPEPYRSAITDVDYFLNRSLSHLIQHCLGCPEASPESAKEVEGGEHLPRLHAECARPDPSLDEIRQLLLNGCDPNQMSVGGQSPLHTLLSSTHLPSTPLAALVGVLLEAGSRLDLTDAEGRSPLNCLEQLLSAGRMEEAATICQLMLTYPGQSCDVNHIDGKDRSLLAHSVTYLDRALELTRVLVNHGAHVWPLPAPTSPVSVDDLARDRELSAFTWFLRSAIQASSLVDAEDTLTCLCHEMGRDPARMKAHVSRVMLSEGKHPRVLGPLYRLLRLRMAPFWTQPQQLRYLAWKAVRKSLGPKRLNAGSKQLGLPSPLRRYLTLTSARSTSSTSSDLSSKD